MSAALFDYEQLKKQIDEVMEPVISMVGNTVLDLDLELKKFFRAVDSFTADPAMHADFGDRALEYLCGFLEYQLFICRRNYENPGENDSEKNLPVAFEGADETELIKGDRNYRPWMYDVKSASEDRRRRIYDRARKLFMIFYDRLDAVHFSSAVNCNALDLGTVISPLSRETGHLMELVPCDFSFNPRECRSGGDPGENGTDSCHGENSAEISNRKKNTDTRRREKIFIPRIFKVLLDCFEMKIMALEYCYEPRNETEIFLRDFKKIFLNTSAEKNITENTPQTGSERRLCSAVMKMLDDEFRDPEKFIEKLISGLPGCRKIIRGLMIDGYRETPFWKNFYVCLLLKTAGYQGKCPAVLNCLVRLYRYLNKFFSFDDSFCPGYRTEKTSDEREQEYALVFHEISGNDAGGTEKSDSKNIFVKTCRIPVRELADENARCCSLILHDYFEAFGSIGEYLNRFGSCSALINVLTCCGTGVQNKNSEPASSFLKDTADYLAGNFSLLNAVKNYFNRRCIELFFKISRYRKTEPALSRAGGTLTEKDILKYLLSESACSEPCRLFISYRSRQEILLRDPSLDCCLKEQNFISLGSSSLHDLLFIKFNELILIVWFDGNEAAAAPLDRGMFINLMLYLRNLQDFADEYYSVFSSIDYRDIFSLAEIDSRKLIEYLVSRDAVIKLSAARIFGKYSGYGDGLVPAVEKSGGGCLPSRLLKDFSAWVRAEFSCIYYAYVSDDFYNFSPVKISSASTLAAFKRITAAYKTKRNGRDNRVRYYAAVPADGVLSRLFTFSKIRLRKNFSCDLDYSGLNIELKNGMLTAEFVSDDVITVFSLFVFLSLPDFFNLCHCVEIVCVPFEPDGFSCSGRGDLQNTEAELTQGDEHENQQ